MEYAIVSRGEHDIKFMVYFADVPTVVANLYLFRRNEECYKMSCGTVYDLALFPEKLKTGLAYRREFVELSRICIGFRVRRLVLLSEIEEESKSLQIFEKLLVECEEKKKVIHSRIILLEAEINNLLELDDSIPSERFNSLLAVPIGWRTITLFLSREFKRLQKPLHERAVEGEEVDNDMNIDKILVYWNRIQLWRLIRCVEARCRLGAESYPKSDIAKGVQPNRLSESTGDADSIASENPTGSAIIEEVGGGKRRGSRRNSDNSILSLGHTLHSKKMLADWNEVCSILGSEDESLLQVVISLQRKLLEDQDFTSFADRVTMSNLAFGIREMLPLDSDSPFLSSTLTAICDHLCLSIESALIGSLRHFPSWTIMLEELRKERVRRQGGKLYSKDKVEIEIDVNGSRKSIPSIDQFVDTDVLHNSMQRMNVQVVIPAVTAKIEECKLKRWLLRGELACLVQFGYSYAAPFIQRNVRRVIVGRKKRLHIQNLLYSSMQAAAVTIQCFQRMKTLSRQLKQLKLATQNAKRTKAIVLIQKIIRMWTKWHQYQVYLQKKRESLDWFAVTKYQALIRGFLDRRRVKATIAANAMIRDTQIKAWAVSKIQKIVRGFLARKILVPSLCVRKTLSPHMLRLVESYLQKGNLWHFLKDLDAEMKRLKSEIEDNEIREDRMASTFVKQVIQKRQHEFDQSWSQFSEVLDGNSKTADYSSINVEDGRLTALGTVKSALSLQKSSSEENSSSLGKIPGESQLSTSSTLKSNKRLGIPGTLLRRAVSSTVQDGVDKELHRLKSSTSKSVKLSEDIREVYGKRVGKFSVLEEVPRHTSKHNVRVKQISSVSQTTDWLSNALSADSLSTNPKMSSGIIASGESLLLDIPRGLDDTLERLLRAAALRCFVPNFFQGKDLTEAYQIYLKLPSGLAKMRYEQEAFEFVRDPVRLLFHKSLKYIKDALPVSKLIMFLRSVDTPSILIETTIEIVESLKRIGEGVPLGYTHIPTVAQSKDIVKGKLSLQDTLAEYKSVLVPKLEEGHLESSEQSKFDPTYASKLLVSMVEQGPWLNLKGPIDDLILHAAFLVCPFAAPNPDCADETNPTELGQNSFKLFINHLQGLDEESSRELIRDRFRAALLMSTPFCLRLKSEGLSKIQDLVSFELLDLGMPSALQNQVEAFLSVSVAMASNAKIVPTARDHLSTAKDLFTVPMIFDPKFQRSPFDPYGRPPRLGPLKSSKKQMFHPNAIKQPDLKLVSLWEDDPNLDDVNIDHGNWSFNSAHADSIDSSKNSSDEVLSVIKSKQENELVHIGKRGSRGEFLPNIAPISAMQSSKGNRRATTVKLSRRDERSMHLMHKFERNLEEKVIRGFDRPFVCKFPNCGQSFSRLYTLKVHEKSHVRFENYHKFKRNPQLFYDGDLAALQAERDIELANRSSLSGPVMQQLDNLSRMSASSHSASKSIAQDIFVGDESHLTADASSRINFGSTESFGGTISSDRKQVVVDMAVAEDGFCEQFFVFS